MKDRAKAQAKAKYLAPIEESELIVRMIEAAGNLKRPKGATVEQALALTDPVTLGIFRRAARAAMIYWKECIDNANANN